jgi:hypothetical protein
MEFVVPCILYDPGCFARLITKSEFTKHCISNGASPKWTNASTNGVDLKCGCYGGEISWAKRSVLKVAPKNVPIIFTYASCHCGYNTYAEKIFNCVDFRNAERMSAKDRKSEGSRKIDFSYWKISLPKRLIYVQLDKTEELVHRERELPHVNITSFGFSILVKISSSQGFAYLMD